jgi:hypothetical protein
LEPLVAVTVAATPAAVLVIENDAVKELEVATIV